MSRFSSPVRAYYWVFAGLLSAVSAVDYVDHLTRNETSDFRDQWLSWLGFTVASTLMVLMIVLVGHLCGPRRGRVRLGADLVAAASAFLIHVKLTGPLADYCFWTGQLNFSSFTWALLLPLPILYAIARGITWTATRVWNCRPENRHGSGVPSPSSS